MYFMYNSMWNPLLTTIRGQWFRLFGDNLYKMKMMIMPTDIIDKPVISDLILCNRLLLYEYTQL